MKENDYNNFTICFSEIPQLHNKNSVLAVLEVWSSSPEQEHPVIGLYWVSISKVSLCHHLARVLRQTVLVLTSQKLLFSTLFSVYSAWIDLALNKQEVGRTRSQQKEVRERCLSNADNCFLYLCWATYKKMDGPVHFSCWGYERLYKSAGIERCIVLFLDGVCLQHVSAWSESPF